MDIQDRADLKRRAADAISGAKESPRKMIFIHTGVTIGVVLLLALVDYLLDLKIANTGGLGGVGTRSVLETAQTILTVLQVVLLLLWQIGYVPVALGISRGQRVEPEDLLGGFRRWGLVLRSWLWKNLQLAGAMMICFYAAYIVCFLSPLAAVLLPDFDIASAALSEDFAETLMAAVEEVSVPMTIVFCVAAIFLVIPHWYRLRLTDYIIMDRNIGAIAAVHISHRTMKRKRMALLKLDLSFWWFYLGELLVMTVAYGDLILPALGVSLPWSDTASYYIFLVLSYLIQLGLYLWKGNQVRVTYAEFYQATMQEQAQELSV